MKVFFALFCATLFSVTVVAQQQLPIPRNIQRAYDQGTRSMDGEPGPNYWQNTADYVINVSFSPETRLISGEEQIVYVNNSPDTLHQILFKLYPNLYKKGAPRSSTIAVQDLTNGVQIQKLRVNGTAKDPGKAHIRGTNMTLPIAPLAPHQKVQFTIRWSYPLNKTSHIRTGEVDRGAYFIAYFFPRIAVYDDIDGWNRFGYNGSQEFYNDFCNFKVNITVPKNYVVWATGTMQNAEEVLTKKYVKRLQKAKKSDAITTIIDVSDLANGHITADKPMNTWKFSVHDVTDFVFATSNHYIWKSSSLVVDPDTGRRTRVDAVYNPKHKDYKEVVHFARKTVQAMSYTFPAWPYPYPHETVFDGLGQMEYPMMVNDNPLQSRTSTITLTDHEIFHTMFPFYMGINETKYAFMDEGWATIAEWIISPLIDSTLVDHYGMAAYDMTAGSEEDLPIMVLSTEQNGTSYYLNSYPKPAMGYLYVKDMLGDKLFTKALHHYIELWHGKHPVPLDFFNAMNKGAGKNMNWFWKSWFYDRGYPDLALTKVKKKGEGYQITVTSVGNKPVPIDLTFTFTDGTTQKMHRSIAVWKQGNKKVTLTLKTNKKVKKVKLGAVHNADADFSNNRYNLR